MCRKGKFHMKKVEKGEFGYINDQRKRYMTKIILYIVIAAAIFFIGLLLNKFDKANIFTVFAILVVLPWARAVVGYVVLWKHHSVTKESYDKVSSVIREDQKLYTDMVITSPEKIMELDYIVKGQGTVIALAGTKGQDIKYIQDYLTKGCRNWASDYTVKIYDSGMEEKFIRAIKNMPVHEVEEKEEEDVMAYLHSLIV